MPPPPYPLAAPPLREGGAAPEPALNQAALELMVRLQTSLDAVRQVGLFCDGIRDLVPHDGFLFQHEEAGVECARGVRTGYDCGYTLAVGPQPLGRLTLFRRRPFGRRETQRLDYLIWCLVYPLRNALTHRTAIDTSLRDTLTGALNRRAFDEALAREVARAARHGSPLSLLVIDIDHFKRINDGHGHHVGDHALKSLVACAQTCTRDADTLYRYGGEEFVMLLGETDLVGASLLAERLNRAIRARPHDCDGTLLTMTASLGVAQLTEGEAGCALFSRADAALYRAKAEGRDRVCLAR